ncbi:MAG: twin-arginine translocase subunit TatC [Bryobacterales bacterium]|nr:twin-arginine translocase subunit TatC [Bryobacteraceae bacterium]MDW8354622.1 twin-arginine translocase subunit TatC [Bryobacterales bacterium]
MSFHEEEQGAPPPAAEALASAGISETQAAGADARAEGAGTSGQQEIPPLASPATAAGAAGLPPSKPPERDAEEEEEEEMLRMSFMEHLEELRMRILLALAGIGVAFVFCLVFANQLWLIISAPAVEALRRIGAEPSLAQIKPMDAFLTIWVKVPMLTAIFLASPWVLYQAWAFIAPGLYRRERRWAAPFIICTAGLFILGGLFAYFVAFRFGLEFLLSIGRDINVKPVVSLTEYFDLFVNVTLGIGLIFELPVLIFFLTLLRVVSPRFLIRNTRYAILIIVVAAALITPTPDVFNLMLFSVPMCLLYFVGVFASYLLVLHREHRRFPWRRVMLVGAGVLLLVAGAAYLAMARFGYSLVPHWPFLAK